MWPEIGTKPLDYAIVTGPRDEHVDAMAKVKAVFNLGAGVNAFGRIRALPPEVALIRLEDAGMAEQMAEYVAYAVLRRFREFAFYAGEQAANRWTQREPLDKQAFQVGILGLGIIGARVATTLRALGFPVSGWSRTPKQVEGIATHAGPEGLDAVLAASRVLIIVLPLTPATKGLLNRRALARLPQGAYVVNVGRGALIVDEDLIALIDSGHLAGAMLDVFSAEPLPQDHPFWHHPVIEMTPHISGLTQIAASVEQVAAKIRALERGEAVGGIVDRSRGY